MTTEERAKKYRSAYKRFKRKYLTLRKEYNIARYEIVKEIKLNSKFGFISKQKMLQIIAQYLKEK